MKKVVAAGIVLLAVTVLAVAIIPTTRDEIHWRWAAHKGDTMSLEAYANAWPEGRHVTEVHAIIDSLHWQVACEQNTIQSYQHFVEKHRSSQHVDEAMSQISILREDIAWTIADSIGTEESLRLFLSDWPQSRRTDQVLRRLQLVKASREIERQALEWFYFAMALGEPIPPETRINNTSLLMESPRVRSRDRLVLRGGELTIPAVVTTGSGFGFVFSAEWSHPPFIVFVNDLEFPDGYPDIVFRNGEISLVNGEILFGEGIEARLERSTSEVKCYKRQSNGWALIPCETRDTP